MLLEYPTNSIRYMVDVLTQVGMGIRLDGYHYQPIQSQPSLRYCIKEVMANVKFKDVPKAKTQRR